MARFLIERLPERDSTVRELAAALSRFELAPSYQRQSEVWGEEKRQLFIDSLVNGFDVPKLYFHRLALQRDKPIFAIVDGKQRLEAIREFVNDKVALSQEFIDEEEENKSRAGEAAGKTFTELTQKASSTRWAIDGAPLRCRRHRNERS